MKNVFYIEFKTILTCIDIYYYVIWKNLAIEEVT